MSEINLLSSNESVYMETERFGTNQVFYSSVQIVRRTGTGKVKKGIAKA